MITPVVVVVEYLAYGKTVSREKLLAIVLLMFGITIATATDSQVSGNLMGIAVACIAVLSSALYQVGCAMVGATCCSFDKRLQHIFCSTIAVGLS
jgi:drug/metabolite transporter (DMT)-like permease